jgi:hypothetical protein
VSALLEERAVFGLCNPLEEILVSDAQIVDEPLRNDVFTRTFSEGIGAEQTTLDIHQWPHDRSGGGMEDAYLHGATLVAVLGTV